MSPHEPCAASRSRFGVSRDLVRGSPAERVVRSVGEPVEEDDEDRIHGGVRLQAREEREQAWPDRFAGLLVRGVQIETPWSDRQVR